MQERLARLAARRGAPAPTARTNRPVAKTVTKPGSKQGSKTKRRHAAKGSRIAALAMSVGTTVGLSGYFSHLDASAASAGSSTLSGTATAVGANASATNSVAAGTASTTATAAAAKTTTATGTALKDGTYAGATSNNRWGPVQVQIMVSGGAIADVTALQTPSDQDRSVQINDYATPILRTETLTAQSATIHTVSGATYTSNSYKQSLQSAIDVARAATAG